MCVCVRENWSSFIHRHRRITEHIGGKKSHVSQFPSDIINLQSSVLGRWGEGESKSKGYLTLNEQQVAKSCSFPFPFPYPFIYLFVYLYILLYAFNLFSLHLYSHPKKKRLRD